MYITLEPCQMCAGAIVQARVTRVVIGSMNAKAGCGGSILNLLEMQEFNHQVQEPSYLYFVYYIPGQSPFHHGQ